LLSIISPTNGATVAGMVHVATRETSSVSWINLFVDGKWVAANPPPLYGRIRWPGTPPRSPMDATPSL
jgi:hypothetical protein